MDRSDEYDREERDVERSSSREERAGDVLGLGGGPVPKSPGDPSADHDPEAVSHRRERMRGAGDEGVSSRTPDRTAGATGIDMGAGGTGTDVSSD